MASIWLVFSEGTEEVFLFMAFNLFQKKKCKLYAPVKGQLLELKAVSDDVFASGMLGKGAAFNYAGNTVYSPCNGTIMLVASTKHAVGIRCANGAEVLIHIGMDTVNLNGKGFKTFVKDGQKVSHGDPLIEIDRPFIEKEGMSLITPVIVTNSNEYDISVSSPSEVDLEDIVIECEKIGKS